MLRGKERKKRKNGYAKLIEVDEQDLHTLKINCKEESILGKANKGINVEKNRLKKLEPKIMEKRKEKINKQKKIEERKKRKQIKNRKFNRDR